MPGDAGKARHIADSFGEAGATWLMEWQPDPESLSKRLRALGAQAR